VIDRKRWLAWLARAAHQPCCHTDKKQTLIHERGLIAQKKTAPEGAVFQVLENLKN